MVEREWRFDRSISEGVATIYMLSKIFNGDTWNEAQEMNFR